MEDMIIWLGLVVSFGGKCCKISILLSFDFIDNLKFIDLWYSEVSILLCLDFSDGFIECLL